MIIPNMTKSAASKGVGPMMHPVILNSKDVGYTIKSRVRMTNWIMNGVFR
jgi:hypothetical protein